MNTYTGRDRSQTQCVPGKEFNPDCSVNEWLTREKTQKAAEVLPNDIVLNEDRFVLTGRRVHL